MNSLIVITGPTASGKTRLAALVAREINAEIISADSRQVYRGMDLGTGKDIDDYYVDGELIRYHLIDIVDAGEKYNLYQYQEDFIKAYNDIVARGKRVILCGGSGLYVESVINAYKLVHVPANNDFRKQCEIKTYDELVEELKQLKRLHNTTDIDSKQRLIRALEIEYFYKEFPQEANNFPELKSIIIAVDISREYRRNRISSRLKLRVDEGMIDEVKRLLSSGISPEDLIYYGLEYKYVTQYIVGEISYNEMLDNLEIAIHQFAKRQMTWFRGMERRGLKLNWLPGELPMEKRVEAVLTLLKYNNFINS